jgi:hypothetical protein
MDLEKKKFFEQRYQDLDDDGISEMLAKRDTLVEEAVAALESIANQRKLAIPEPTMAAFAVRPIPPDNEAEARALWNSFLRWGVNATFIVMLAGPVSVLRWGAIPVVIFGLIGQLASYEIAKSICSNENLHHEDMRARLWIMLMVGVIGWLLLTFVAVGLKNSH